MNPVLTLTTMGVFEDTGCSPKAMFIGKVDDQAAMGAAYF